MIYLINILKIIAKKYKIIVNHKDNFKNLL